MLMRAEAALGTKIIGVLLVEKGKMKQCLDYIKAEGSKGNKGKRGEKMKVKETFGLQ